MSRKPQAQERPETPVPTTAMRGRCCASVSMHEALLFSVDAFGNTLEIADDSEHREQAEDVVGGVDLPPVESLTRRGLVAVVIVMPSLSESDNGEEKTVAAIVPSIVPRCSPDMGHGVDAAGAVEEQYGADKASPD